MNPLKGDPVMSAARLPLTEKRRRFVEEYLIHCNASRAARAAGYSDASAASIGSDSPPSG
jgi:hypothetical protein